MLLMALIVDVLDGGATTSTNALHFIVRVVHVLRHVKRAESDLQPSRSPAVSSPTCVIPYCLLCV